jgi:hypothetical protein
MSTTTKRKPRIVIEREHHAIPVEDTFIVAWFFQGTFLAARCGHDGDGIAAVQRSILAEYPEIERVSIPIGRALPSHQAWDSAQRASARRVAEKVYAARDRRAAFRRIQRQASDRIDDRPVRERSTVVDSAPAPVAPGPRLNWRVWDARMPRASALHVHATSSMTARLAFCERLGLSGAMPDLRAEFIPAR